MQGRGVVQTRAHDRAVDVVRHLQVLVLGGIHTPLANRFVDSIASQFGSKHDGARVVRVHPVALVIVLIVRRSDVPPLVQRHLVVLVAGEVAALVHHTFSIAHLDKIDDRVRPCRPVSEIIEGAERGSRVVELGNGRRILGQLRIVRRKVHALVRPRVISDRIECVDMAGSAAPGHLEPGDGDKVTRHVVGVGDGLEGGPLRAGAAPKVCGNGRRITIEPVRMVRHCHEVDARRLGGVIGFLWRPLPVRQIRVTVQPAKVDVEVANRETP